MTSDFPSFIIKSNVEKQKKHVSYTGSLLHFIFKSFVDFCDNLVHWVVLPLFRKTTKIFY